MAITGSSMWTRRKTAKNAITPYQGSDPAALAAYFDAIGIADSQAIIDEIKTATVASTGVDPQGGSVVSTSTSIT